MIYANCRRLLKEVAYEIEISCTYIYIYLLQGQTTALLPGGYKTYVLVSED